MVSKKMSEKRAEDLERITTEYGTKLRMNRSIQAEGSFADVKEDMNFRRYLYRGKENVLAESILIGMGRNINKLVVLRGWSVRKGTAGNILRVPIGCHALPADEESGCNAPVL